MIKESLKHRRCELNPIRLIHTGLVTSELDHSAVAPRRSAAFRGQTDRKEARDIVPSVVVEKRGLPRYAGLGSYVVALPTSRLGSCRYHQTEAG